MQDHRIMLCFFYSYVGACFVAIEEPCQRTFFTFSTAAYSTVIATCMVGNAFGLTLKGIGAQFCLYASSTVVIMSSITHVKDKSHNISEATHVIVLSCVTCIFILFITSDKVQRSISSDMVTMLAYSILLMYWIILAYLDGSYLLSLKTPVSSLTMELESEWELIYSHFVHVKNARDKRDRKRLEKNWDVTLNVSTSLHIAMKEQHTRFEVSINKSIKNVSHK